MIPAIEPAIGSVSGPTAFSGLGRTAPISGTNNFAASFGAQMSNLANTAASPAVSVSSSAQGSADAQPLNLPSKKNAPKSISAAPANSPSLSPVLPSPSPYALPPLSLASLRLALPTQVNFEDQTANPVEQSAKAAGASFSMTLPMTAPAVGPVFNPGQTNPASAIVPITGSIGAATADGISRVQAATIFASQGGSNSVQDVMTAPSGSNAFTGGTLLRQMTQAAAIPQNPPPSGASIPVITASSTAVPASNAGTDSTADFPAALDWAPVATQDSTSVSATKSIAGGSSLNQTSPTPNPEPGAFSKTQLSNTALTIALPEAVGDFLNPAVISSVPVAQADAPRPPVTDAGGNPSIPAGVELTTAVRTHVAAVSAGSTLADLRQKPPLAMGATLPGLQSRVSETNSGVPAVIPAVVPYAPAAAASPGMNTVLQVSAGENQPPINAAQNGTTTKMSQTGTTGLQDLSTHPAPNAGATQPATGQTSSSPAASLQPGSLQPGSPQPASPQPASPTGAPPSGPLPIPTGAPQTASAALANPTLPGSGGPGTPATPQKFGNSGLAGSPNSPSNLPSTVEIPTSPGPGPVQMAHMVSQATQSEMRIGLNTSAFGSVEVRTTVHASDVGVVIGSEKGDLRSLLSNELPGIANSLQQQNLRLNQVNFQQASGFSGNLSSGGDSQPRSFASPQAVPRSAQNSESSGDELPAPLDSVSAALGNGSTSLSILA